MTKGVTFVDAVANTHVQRYEIFTNKNNDKKKGERL